MYLRHLFAICLFQLISNCIYSQSNKNLDTNACVFAYINPTVYTFGYEFSELDTIRIYVYKKNSAFSLSTDSFISVQSKQPYRFVGDSMLKKWTIDLYPVESLNQTLGEGITENRLFNSANDYVILIAGDSFKINNIEVGKLHAGKRSWCSVVSLQNNGEEWGHSNLEFWKPGFRAETERPGFWGEVQRQIMIELGYPTNDTGNKKKRRRHKSD